MTNKEKLIWFYKNNLKNHCSTVVELLNGEYYLMIGPDMFLTHDGFMNYVNDDLSGKYTKRFGIKSAYSYIGFYGYAINPDKLTDELIINDSVELTIEEIADEFNISVKNLRIKKMNKTELIKLYNSLEEGTVLVLVTKYNNYILVNNTLVSYDGFMPLSDYYENLTTEEYDKDSDDFAINKIYMMNAGLGFNSIKDLNHVSHKALIWDRNMIEVTMNDIAEKFGIPVENLRIKE